MPKLNFTHLKTRMLSGSLLLLGALLGPNEKINAQILINEDFSTANGLVPPSNWLNQDAGGSDGQQIWTFNNPGGRNITGGTPGFSGQFAIIDSDDEGNGNTQNSNLVTPAFSASNTTQSYVLEFDDNWEQCCGAVGQVQVFNGTTWTTVFSEPSTGDGDGDEDPSVHRSINITAGTGNSAAAKVRFHYEGDWDYWWAIDNVKITAISCTAPAATFTAALDCANSQFSVSVNVTNMGSATSLSLSDGTTTYGSPITATGTYTAGPFSSGTTQTITLIHNASAYCNLESSQISYNCSLPNDNCEYAASVTPSTTCTPTSGSTIGATVSSPSVDPGCIDAEAGNDVWFSFTATTALASVKVSNLQPSNSDAIIGEVGFSVYEANCAALGTPLNCGYSYYFDTDISDDPLLVSGLTVGQDYLIRVHSDFAADVDFNQVTSDYNFDVCVQSVTPVPNDLICDAITLTIDGPTDCQNTATATANNDPSDINNCSTPNNTVWYKFTPATNGPVLVNIKDPAAGDPLYAWVFMYSVTDPCGSPAYTQIPFSANTCQAGSDGVNGSLTSSLSGTLTAGQTYYIVLDGNSGDVGEYCISISSPPPPPGCVTNISPTNGETNIIVDAGTDPSFSWNAESGATSYDVYLGTTAGGETNIGNVTGTSTTISGLTIDTTYYWYVVPVGPGGPATGCVSNEFSFTTSAATLPPNCTYLNSPDDGSTVGNFPTLNWGAADYTESYNIYLDMNTTPTTLYGTTTTQTQYTGSAALAPGTYYWYVQPVNSIGAATGCESSVYSFTVVPSPTNDVPTGATVINVGQPCTGNSFTNEFANHNPGEPYPNCQIQSQGEHSVWFQFVAPTSGGVKISTDIGTLGTLTDTKIGLFSVGEASNYSTFNLIACDDDNGVIDDGYTSTIFTTALTGGQTYYVEVDGYSNSDQGTFCLEVTEINPTMLSSTASCADLQTPVGNNPAYNGWITLLDEDGALVANVRNTAGGQANEYSGSYNVDGNGFGTPRQDANGRYYLSRNYMISNPGISTPVDVRFYFHPGEIATLAGVTSNATNLSNLNVTKQESNTCNANYADGNGATSILLQNLNGSVNGVSWIQVSTSSFSNFYLMGGITPLAIDLKSISATNIGNANQVNWITAKEETGDYFELERSSNGKNFSFLAKINSKGRPSDYTFYDNNPFENENYYRLKLINKDGKFIYSKVVEATVNVKGSFTVEAYPNPAKNNVNVKVFGSQNGDITLADIAGRVIYQSKVKGNEINIDLTKVANGVYFLKYVDNNLTKTIKLNKQ
ncbi:T9SS type A sorting domain-containing protein [Taibaiella lutea]|uniref:T9SS type A sorting domain-containing protein n=1 Tax=Taibaiella lutea TaxID=2608001 RepID=A0A5M6CC55_9BACT|nr:T9SS type A sorting domain-containing protein [Taibaiella lutea]KAA5532717.1 T9SS type A sorting domain-containing protein [Taibaiella lutea]